MKNKFSGKKNGHHSSWIRCSIKRTENGGFMFFASNSFENHSVFELETAEQEIIQTQWLLCRIWLAIYLTGTLNNSSQQDITRPSPHKTRKSIYSHLWHLKSCSFLEIAQERKSYFWPTKAEHTLITSWWNLHSVCIYHFQYLKLTLCNKKQRRAWCCFPLCLFFLLGLDRVPTLHS